MSKLKVEFFHDAVCGWCYVLSPRLRNFLEKFDVEIEQKCFVLQRNDQEMINNFGSLAEAKDEILKHWKSCQMSADDPSTINISGMREKSFSYPSGFLAALGAKAAELMGGSDTHWDYFDQIQHLHLKVNENIGDRDIVIFAAEKIGLNKEKFIQLLDSEKVKNEVNKDIERSKNLGIRTIPSLVINREKVISQTLSNEELESLFKSYMTPDNSEQST